MHPTILLLACLIYHEDRAGDLTAQWAIGHSLLVRWAQQGRYPETLKEILREPNQYPWVAQKGLECSRPKKEGPNQVAWDVIVERAQLIWNARDTVWHNYPCFYHAKIDSKYKRPRGRNGRRYGAHIFWEC